MNYAAGGEPDRRLRWGTSTATESPTWSVANYGSNNVSVLLGNGDGTFQAAVNFAAGNDPDIRGRGGLQWRRQTRPRGRKLRDNTRERAAGQRRRHLPDDR